ncbi:MAG: Ppx/GppA family phosphatase [Gammaproteobacteria bacterium]|nr:Ppx/GppA family phosphatase [Gammaproteobacteria bacterium]
MFDKTKLIVVVDLGSNSFHMTVTRSHDGQLTVIDSLKESVRLAAGVTAEHTLDTVTQKRALECLARFAQRLQNIKHDGIRVVGTNALRQAHQAEDFVALAEKTLGHRIDIISGIEEARLIYAGVYQDHPLPERRNLVIDIGGGSTEFIIGEGPTPRTLESLYMGCVNFTRRFFDAGYSHKRMQQAITAARQELEPIEISFRALGWQHVLGSSGSIRSIEDTLLQLKLSEHGITASGLKKLHQLLAKDDRLPNLSADRRPVFFGGLAILTAAFDALNIEHMEYSNSALREGVLHELLGRQRQNDVRNTTIQHFVQRYAIDKTHAQRVQKTARSFYQQAQINWLLSNDNKELADYLDWAAQLHEIGLAVAHSGYHRHGAYLLRHSDMPGFSIREQKYLALLVNAHRRKIRAEYFKEISSVERPILLKLLLILRISVLLHRNRLDNFLPDLKISAHLQGITLSIAEKWLQEHPLTLADIQEEQKHWSNNGFELLLKTQL